MHVKASEKLDVITIKKILGYIKNIEECFEHFDIKSSHDLESMRLAQLATTQAITNMFEAKKKLRPEAIDVIPVFDRVKIGRARNIASHDYDSVDFNIIFDICKRLMGEAVNNELNRVISVEISN